MWTEINIFEEETKCKKRTNDMDKHAAKDLKLQPQLFAFFFLNPLKMHRNINLNSK